MKPFLAGLIILFAFIIIGFIIGSMMTYSDAVIIAFGFSGLIFGGAVWAGLSEDEEKNRRIKKNDRT